MDAEEVTDFGSGEGSAGLYWAVEEVVVAMEFPSASRV
jgi:hypothetical protein